MGNLALKADRKDDAIDMREICDSIGFLTRLAQVRTYDTFFEDLGQFGLRPGEYSTLLLIARNPGIRQGILAQALCIKPAHMTKLVRTFEDRGLVERTIPDHDRRSVHLDLTDAGHAFVAQHRQAFSRHEKRLNSTLSADELRALKLLLRKYVGYDGEKPA